MSNTPYGLPAKVQYCKKCVISNQRPSSVIEFKHQSQDHKPTIYFDEHNVCSACRFQEQKINNVDWQLKEKNF